MAAHTFRCDHCRTHTPDTLPLALLAGLEFVVTGGKRKQLATDLRLGNLVFDPRWGGAWLSLHIFGAHVGLPEVPDTALCRLCGAEARRIVSRSAFYLRADGTQLTGWSSPGMVGIDYRHPTEPWRGKARHLKDETGATINMARDPDNNPGMKQLASGRRAGLPGRVSI